jgi:hypothetical protein
MIQWNLSWTETDHNVNLSLAENGYSPEDPNFKHMHKA